LGGVAAITVTPAQLFQFVIQVFHKDSPLKVSRESIFR
jgi:hypothetical protein